MKGIVKAVVLVIASLIVFMPLASALPDGLERVAESLGIKETESIWSGIMPDYAFPFTENPYANRLITGLVGLAIVFIVTWSVGLAIARKRCASK